MFISFSKWFVFAHNWKTIYIIVQKRRILTRNNKIRKKYWVWFSNQCAWTLGYFLLKTMHQWGRHSFLFVIFFFFETINFCWQNSSRHMYNPNKPMENTPQMQITKNICSQMLWLYVCARRMCMFLYAIQLLLPKFFGGCRRVWLLFIHSQTKFAQWNRMCNWVLIYERLARATIKPHGLWSADE